MVRLAILRLSGAALALFAMSASMPAFAETLNLKADLKGGSEVPPVTSPGSGSMTGTYDTANKKLSWSVNYSGLTAAPTAGHFHGPADPDKNAGVSLPFQAPLASPIKGEATLTDAQAEALMGGRWYVNLHTAAHPAGEIRGQVMK